LRDFLGGQLQKPLLPLIYFQGDQLQESLLALTYFRGGQLQEPFLPFIEFQGGHFKEPLFPFIDFQRDQLQGPLFLSYTVLLGTPFTRAFPSIDRLPGRTVTRASPTFVGLLFLFLPIIDFFGSLSCLSDTSERPDKRGSSSYYRLPEKPETIASLSYFMKMLRGRPYTCHSLNFLF
jgi:hypothetical protein